MCKLKKKPYCYTNCLYPPSQHAKIIKGVFQLPIVLGEVEKKKKKEKNPKVHIIA